MLLEAITAVSEAGAGVRLVLLRGCMAPGDVAPSAATGTASSTGNAIPQLSV